MGIADIFGFGKKEEKKKTPFRIPVEASAISTITPHRINAAERLIKNLKVTGKHTALPSVVPMMTSLLPSVISAPINSSPSAILIAMMPLERGFENSDSDVFFTVPRFVHIKT